MQIEKKELVDRIEYGYYQGDKFIWHREDGPAIEFVNGDKEYWINGEIIKREFKYHTEHGYYEGDKFIWHREDGPAVECKNGDKEYWINGEKVDGRKIKALSKIYRLSKVCK
jgi:hypothetical protein